MEEQTKNSEFRSDSNSDLEKLRNIAKTPIDIKDTSKLSEVHQFSLALNIIPGKTKVPASVIYKAYTEWKKEKTKLNNSRFFKQFSKMFQKKRNATTTFYMLDPTPFNLSSEKNNNEENTKEEKKESC